MSRLLKRRQLTLHLLAHGFGTKLEHGEVLRGKDQGHVLCSEDLLVEELADRHTAAVGEGKLGVVKVKLALAITTTVGQW